MNKKIKKILISLGLIGLIDTIYLSLPYISNTKTYCPSDNPNSCDVVLTSEYSSLFFDIPNVFLGILFYLTIILTFIFWDKIKSKIPNIFKITIFFTSIASAFYVYFIYLQKFIIGEYCPYCLLSSIITFTIWIILIKEYNKKH